MKFTQKELDMLYKEHIKDKDLTIGQKASIVTNYINKTNGSNISEVMPEQELFPDIVDFIEQDWEFIFSINFVSLPKIWVKGEEVEFEGNREKL